MVSISTSLRAVRLSACMAFAGVAASCGGAAPAPVQPPAPPPRTPVVIAAPDLSPLPEPAELVALLRWKSPAASFESLRDWTGLPFGPKDLLDLISASDLADVLAYDAPVDAAAALDPKASALTDWAPFAAVATGLKSLEEGRRLAETLGSVKEIGPGVYRLRIGKSTHRKADKATCLIAAAAGPAPARLVCGNGDRDLDALAGYLTRTLPSKDLGPADLHIEMRFSPLVQRYGTLMNEGLHVGAALVPDRFGIGEPKFDRALHRAALGVVDELMALSGDLDRMTIDAAMQPERTDFSVQIRMRDRQSWTAGSMTSMAKRSGPPPASFWRLPADATAAGFSVTNDPQRTTEIWHTVQELIDGYLLREKLPAADRAALTDLLSPSRATGAPVVGASSGLDWALWGVAEPTKSRESIVNAMAACQRPKLLALAARLNAGDTDESPKAAKPLVPIRCKAVAPAAGLPKGTLDFEITLFEPSRDDATTTSGKKKKAAKPRPTEHKSHVLVASDASNTWIAFGADRAKLAAPLLAVVQTPANGATLARRDGLDALRAGSLVAGGFVTLEMFVRMFGGMKEDFAAAFSSGGGDSDLARALVSTPHRGKTPMVFSSSITDAGAIAWTGRFSLPKAFAEDLVVLGATTMLQGHGPAPKAPTQRRKP
jgi:hypothetical protein